MSQKIGISLCGGGARGMAHIGVLRALEEHNVYPTYIAGASAGSIVGCLYAAGKRPADMLDIIQQTRLYEIFRPGFSFRGFMSLGYLDDVLKEQIPHNSFEELKHQLWIAVSNLKSGECEYLNKGNHLSEAVLASSSIPLVFKPTEIEGQLYVDGGLLDNLPIKPLRPQCDVLIGVNVNQHGWTRKKYEEMVSIGVRSFEMILWTNIQENFEACDVQIDVEGAYDCGIFDFHKAEEVAEAGYEATLKVMPDLLNLTLLTS